VSQPRPPAHAHFLHRARAHAREQS
jgi:hypothetical protein